MDSLIPVINRLQDVLMSVGMHLSLDLPQIVVVGSQSVGKSSVLESLVGRDFLPRGTGIVTRRPLILQLRNVSEKEAKREWGEFQHLAGKRFEDFDAIRQEIEDETDRTCGKNKAVSANPILLRIFSPHVIDLTLVDLPGITKIPIGDQPNDVEYRIRDLITHYISKPNSLILAVTAANTDIANSDALKLAREFDPEGARTIGVLTKMDLMDEGTDALEILQGRMYPLKLGYVGVVCRSQKDIVGKRSIRDSLRIEEKFFRTHPAYKALASRCGSVYMARLLHKVLMYHIRDCLPALRGRIAEMMVECETELAGLGEPLVGMHGGQAAVLLNIFTKFSKNFQDAIDGKLHSDQLVGGARIHYIFNDIFMKTIAEFDSFHGLTDGEIRTAIRNATGPRAALFVPEVAFETLVKRQVAKLEEPALQCAELVYEELTRVVQQQCEIAEMQRFVILRERVQELVRGVLQKCLQPTNSMISGIIACELAYVNTNHPDFIGGSRAISAVRPGPKESVSTSIPVPTPPNKNQANMPPVAPPSSSVTAPSPATDSSATGGFLSFIRGSSESSTTGSPSPVPSAPPPPQIRSNKLGSLTTSSLRLGQVPAVVMAPESPSGREMIETEIIKSLILSYFNIVKKTVCDIVPKICMQYMVNAAKDVIQKELVTELYKEELFGGLLKEAEDVAERRSRAREMLTLLKTAMDILAQIRDHNVAAVANEGEGPGFGQKITKQNDSLDISGLNISLNDSVLGGAAGM